jgi:hypothetical protein
MTAALLVLIPMASRQGSSVTVFGPVLVLILTTLDVGPASELVHATFLMILPNSSLEERGVVEESIAVSKVSMKKYARN